MSRTLLLCTVLLAGCDRLFGTVEDRQACTTSAECPAGQFCADTGGSRICWADAVDPVVTAVTAGCPTSPCLRDGVLTVEATVMDDQELGPVTVTLDLDGGARAVAMIPVSGALHRATLDLSEWPLAGVTATVIATVRAEDGARNGASAQAPAGQRPGVTRIRAPVALGTTPTAPALMADGTVVVGGADGRLHFVASGAATPNKSIAVFGPSVVQPPTIGQSAIWVVSSNNRLYASALDGSSVSNGNGSDMSGAAAGPAAITAATPTPSAPELAFVVAAGGRVSAVQAASAADGLVHFIGGMGAFSSGPSLANDHVIFAVTSTTAPAATVHQFTFPDGLREGFTRQVGSLVTMPISIDGLGNTWTGSADLGATTLQQTLVTGEAGSSIPLSTSVGGSPVVLAGGDVAICVGGELRRFTPAGAPVWTAPLTGPGLTPLVLAEPGGAAALLVPTRAGAVDLIDAATGARRWSASLTVNVELREGTVRAAAGARTSTAWFTSADGLLHGLVVEGALDGAAPWPKAWHDARNTGNLAAPH